MAKTNRDRIDEGLALLRKSLAPFVERELRSTFRENWLDKVRHQFPDKRNNQFDESTEDWDVKTLLSVLTKFWGDHLQSHFGPRPEKSGTPAHAPGRESYPDTYRAPDSVFCADSVDRATPPRPWLSARCRGRGWSSKVQYGLPTR